VKAIKRLQWQAALPISTHEDFAAKLSESARIDLEISRQMHVELEDFIEAKTRRNSSDGGPDWN